MNRYKTIWNTEVDNIKRVIMESETRFDVLKKINRVASTTTYRRLRQFETEHNVDTSHYKGYKSKKQRKKNQSLSNDEIFCVNSKVSVHVPKLRILRDNLIPYNCAHCHNLGLWNDKKLVLHLEHIDGNPTNNELSNLCFLCPNCHSQTSTYCRSTRNLPLVNVDKSKENAI